MAWIWDTDVVPRRGDETIARCHQCGQLWAHNAGPDTPDPRFLYITRYCPNCLARKGYHLVEPDVTGHRFQKTTTATQK